jgi:3-hydroxyacyl-CoA dehydrogenase / enoyl-CoA hydratase / 3-hydroxybutyryl-CoA epimerase
MHDEATPATAPPTHWTLTVDGDQVGWLTLDKQGASTNTLSRPVLEDLARALDEVARHPLRALVVRSGKKNGFIAGADIQEFTALTDAREGYELVRAGQAIIGRIEALPIPTIALIHGFALGGGLELALACRYRIAADDGRVSIGLPEVQLGIHPGFGGTVRTPRLIGVRRALDMMLTGRALKAEEALSVGLVDSVVAPATLETEARRFVHNRPSRHRPPLLDRLMALAPLRGFVTAGVLKTVAGRARAEHYPAPYAIVELWRRYGAHGARAYEAEARSVADLFVSPTARNLIRVFFLQNRLKSLATVASGIARVHVIGAGVMGGDIAAWCAVRGLEVTLQDREQRFIDAALERARATFAKRLKDPGLVAAASQRLRADLAGDGVATADLVIEAIVEKAEAKQALYRTLEPRLKPAAVLATNTSSIRLETLSQGLADPGRLAGLHFFNPVARMPLVEVIQGPASDPAAVARLVAFTKQLDKLPVPCRSAPGFLVNRVLFAYLREALRLVAEGTAKETVDEAAVAFGMPQGPVELADTVGLDVALGVAEVLAVGGDDNGLEPLRALVAAGHLGRKFGQGFYPWSDGKVVRTAAAAPAPADLEDRLILPLVNEAVACLREGVVADGDLVDAGIIFGTGFAPFRGGPLAYARSRGIDAIVARLADLSARYGERFAPDAGWKDL